MTNQIGGERYLRMRQIIGDEKKGIPPMLPVSRSALYAWMAAGTFPKPIKTGNINRATAFWRESEVVAFIENMGKS